MATIEVLFDVHAWDKTSFPKLRVLKESLANSPQPTLVNISLAKTVWMEPQSLLALGLLCERAVEVEAEIDLDLGDVRDPERLSFFSFIESQGFLSIFPDKVRCHLVRDSKKRNLSIDEAGDVLASFDAKMHFDNQDLLRAQILNLDVAADDRDVITHLVGTLIEEMRVRAFDNFFKGTENYKYETLQSMKTFLSETLLNASEHSRASESKFQFALFGRIRQGVPSDLRGGARWHNIFNRERKNALAMNRFNVNKRTSWIEVFVCDVGSGFLAHSDAWAGGDYPPKYKSRLQAALESKSPLQTSAKLLFWTPISRFTNRHDQYRTKLTGLQAINRTLRKGGGYIRVSDGVESVGHMFPVSEETAPDLAWDEPGGRQTKNGLGTFISLHLQPFDEASEAASERLVPLTAEAHATVVEALRGSDIPTKASDLIIIDRRFQRRIRPNSKDLFDQLESVRGSSAELIIRLPKRASKQDFAEWIYRTIQAADDADVRATLFFVDCTAHDAEIYCDFLEAMSFTKPSRGRVVIVTRRFEQAVYSLKQNRFKYDRQSTENFAASRNQRCKASDVATSLKLMDSAAFWGDGETISVKEVYFPARCIWRRADEHNSELVFFGYLDFQSALFDSLRFSTCLRALRRYFVLYDAPKISYTDDLVKELALKAMRETDQGRGAKRNEGRVIYLGSVAVSGDTLIAEQKVQSLPDDNLLAFFVHIDGTGSKAIGSLLYWMPPKVPALSKILMRISGTPYVSEAGDYATSINRFRVNKTGQLDSLYCRSPTDTYQDFMKYGSLQLGHYERSTGHELLNVDISSVIKIAERENEQPWQWLISTFEKARLDTEVQWIFLFPQNQTNNELLRSLTDYYSDDVEFLKCFFLIPFLRLRITEPFLFSPLVEERIKSYFQRVTKQKLGAQIVDITGVTGRTNRQIGQLVRHCGIQSVGRDVLVRTVILLDRTGLPMRSAVMDDFFRRNDRYWRWDVPRLGDNRSCSLCGALSSVAHSTSKMDSTKIRRSVTRWIEYWGVQERSAYDRLGHGASQRPSVDATIKFGIEFDGKKWVTNLVSHRSIESLLSNLVEITRLTHRSDIAIAWAKKKEDVDTRILIVSVNIFYFYSQFTVGEKKKYLSMLVELLWDCDHTSVATALGALALQNCSSRQFEELFRSTIEPVLSEKPINNDDLAVAMRLLSSRFNKAPLLQSQGPVYDQNLARCGFWNGYFQYAKDLFNQIGWTSHTWHHSALRSSLNKLALSNDQSLAKFGDLEWESALWVADTLNDLASKLYAIHDNVDDGEFLGIQPEKDAEILSSGSQKIQESVRFREEQSLASEISRIRAYLFGATGSPSSLTVRYRRALLSFVDHAAQLGQLLDEPVRILNSQWDDYLRQKNMRWRGWAPDCAGRADPPSVYYGGRDEWENAGYVYYDKNVIGAIYDTLLNVVHSTEPIPCPWKTLDPRMLADAWWRVEQDEGALRIEIANGCKRGTRAVYENKESYLKIKVNGADVRGPIENNGIGTTIITLPFIEKELES